jgi:hypothetical protein
MTNEVERYVRRLLTTEGRKMQHSFTHIYCDNCKKITECVSDDKLYEDTSGKFAGGDICCASCFLVIATVYILNAV